MARHKSFKASGKNKSAEPVTFDIGYELDGNEKVEEFSAVPNKPGAVILDFIAEADSRDGGRAAAALVSFINDALIDDDKKRFAAVIRDPKIDVEIETLAGICEYLVSEYASRPTQQS